VSFVLLSFGQFDLWILEVSKKSEDKFALVCRFACGQYWATQHLLQRVTVSGSSLSFSEYCPATSRVASICKTLSLQLTSFFPHFTFEVQRRWEASQGHIANSLVRVFLLCYLYFSHYAMLVSTEHSGSSYL
jgi:hypothetical protein